YKFESLSLDYANKFETSPPLWPEDQNDEQQEKVAGNVATPSIIFPNRLDNCIVKVLAKMREASAKTDTLRLDFSRVKEVDP
ncbi:hypothetical protein, partial [Campylobacter jejuni]|uniref:hypothetical protein n=1 Tax=Campylobacter jejuni TaxID=197 RepID=UPI00352B6935